MSAPLLQQLPEPRLPMREEPWPVGKNETTCPVCGSWWRPFAGSKLPCHASCLFDEIAVAHLDQLASSGAYRTQQDLADDLGISVGILRAALGRGQWSRHAPAIDQSAPEVPELGLTLHQPWCDAILEHGKPVENRGWAPPRNVVGKLIALHAGLHYDVSGAIWIERTLRLKLKPEESERGAIVGVARVVRAFQRGQGDLYGNPIDDLAASAWAFGPWCWVLGDVTRVIPIEAVGRQRLWKLSAALREKLTQRMREVA